MKKRSPFIIFAILLLALGVVLCSCESEPPHEGSEDQGGDGTVEEKSTYGENIITYEDLVREE